MESDEALVRRSKQGDSAAYAELVRRWSAPILATCRARIRSRDAAEDLAQETFLRGWISIRTLENEANIGAWLRTIAQRLCLDWLRRKQNHNVPFSVLGDSVRNGDAFVADTIGPKQELEREREQQHLERAIQSLPDAERETLELYLSGDWTYQQLAEIQDIAIGTVNARLSRAKDRLRRHFQLMEESER